VHCFISIQKQLQKSYLEGPLLKSGRTGPPRPITPPRPRIILKPAHRNIKNVYKNQTLTKCLYAMSLDKILPLLLQVSIDNAQTAPMLSLLCIKSNQHVGTENSHFDLAVYHLTTHTSPRKLPMLQRTTKGLHRTAKDL